MTDDLGPLKKKEKLLLKFHVMSFGISATIRTHQEIECLLSAGFLPPNLHSWRLVSTICSKMLYPIRLILSEYLQADMKD